MESKKNGRNHRAAKGQGARSGQFTKSFELSRTLAPSGRFNRLMAQLASDVLKGQLDPSVVNAANRSYSNMLRMLDLQYRFARLGAASTPKAMAQLTEKAES